MMRLARVDAQGRVGESAICVATICVATIDVATIGRRGVTAVSGTRVGMSAIWGWDIAVRRGGNAGVQIRAGVTLQGGIGLDPADAAGEHGGAQHSANRKGLKIWHKNT